MGERRLQQFESADDVRLNKRRRIIDGTIDMTLRGKMHDSLRPVSCQEMGDQAAIADVAVYEDMPRIIVQRGQRVLIAGISERIQIDDAHSPPVRQVDKIRAYETRPAGD